MGSEISVTSLTPKERQDLETIVNGYEGIGGFNPKDGRYYPYHGKADRPKDITIFKGHLLSQEDITTGKYSKGITAEEGERLFKADLKVRETRVLTTGKFNPKNGREAVAIISSLYNCPSMWEWSNSPRNYYAKYLTGGFNSIGGIKLNLLNCCKYMMMYHNSNGKPQLGLYRRRATEVLYMLTGVVLLGNKDLAQEIKLFKELRRLGVDLSGMSKFKMRKGVT